MSVSPTTKNSNNLYIIGEYIEENCYCTCIGCCYFVGGSCQTFFWSLSWCRRRPDNFELKGDALPVGGFDVSLDGLSGNGIAGGAFVGYDLSLGSGFVGIEAGASISGAKMSASAPMASIALRFPPRRRKPTVPPRASASSSIPTLACMLASVGSTPSSRLP